ncbi:EexN family lipoprotein [Hydrogenophaga sp.]|uniref:EexN family lipoprotein n=1 Tax=Hydrogenophaga sp. TaxID=1904254 RepID=UPI0035B4B71B
MKKSSILATILAAVSASLLLSACGKTQPAETVESLKGDPERLKLLREQCKTERTRLGDELCDRVAEATKRRFFGDGKVPYNPPKESPKF